MTLDRSRLRPYYGDGFRVVDVRGDGGRGVVVMEAPDGRRAELGFSEHSMPPDFNAETAVVAYVNAINRGLPEPHASVAGFEAAKQEGEDYDRRAIR